MKVGNHIIARVIGWLVVITAVTTVGITALVYSGPKHREAVKSLTRKFFVLVWKASQHRRSELGAAASATPEGGIIQ